MHAWLTSISMDGIALRMTPPKQAYVSAVLLDHLVQLHELPIKSCPGYRDASHAADDGGLEHDVDLVPLLTSFLRWLKARLQHCVSLRTSLSNPLAPPATGKLGPRLP